MKITSLTLRNFLAITEARIELADRGLLLIQGENVDDPSADSNGAGKSSIVDAVCWCLFGETARGISGDHVVKRDVKKEQCSVTVMMEIDGDHYEVTRTRKPATLTVKKVASSQVPITGATGSGSIQNLTKGTEKETQVLIEKLIGCSLDVFKAALYAGQEAMPDLPGMTDKQLKVLIEEGAGVDTLADAYAIARTEKAKLEQDNLTCRANLTAQEQLMLVLTNALKQASDDHARFEAERVRRTGEIQSTLRDLAEKVRTLDSQRMDDAPFVAEIVRLEAKLAEVESERTELSQLQDQVRLASNKVASLKTSTQMAKTAAESAAAALANVDKVVGTPCRSCGKPYEEHDLDTAREHATKQLDEAKAKLAAEAAALRAAVAVAATCSSALEAHRQGMTDVSLTAAALRTERESLGKIQQMNSERAGLANDMRRLMQEVAAVKSQVNPHLAAMDTHTESTKNALQKIAEIKAEQEKISRDLLEAAAAVEVFGPAGVRAHILDTVTPFLNARTAEYLGTLSDGTITATWSTLGRTAKGDLREKFNIDVSSLHGAASFAGLSGGEKRKVRLACFMALQDLVATRASKPINLFIADEVDHALDQAGLERLMTVLEQKARDRGTVIVISHSDLKDWVDQVVTVTKKGGGSTLSGAVS